MTTGPCALFFLIVARIRVSFPTEMAQDPLYHIGFINEADDFHLGCNRDN